MNDLRIRELRFGPPKKRKTFGVVSSYPTPMFVQNTDMDGLSVMNGHPTRQPKIITSAEFQQIIRDKVPATKLPPVLAVDYIYAAYKRISVDKTVYSDQMYRDMGLDINALFDHCPFNSVVVDSLTGLSDACVGWVGKNAPTLMADPRKWGGVAGGKLKEYIAAGNALPAQCVVWIGHQQTSEDEKTNVTSIVPAIVSGLKATVGAMVSQFLYQNSDGTTPDGKPKFVIYRQPTVQVGLARDIGMRTGTGAPCGPTFEEIYG